MQSTESEPLPSFVLQNAYLRMQRYDNILEYATEYILKNLIYFIISIDIQNIITTFAHNLYIMIMSKNNEYIKSAANYVASVLEDNVVVKPVCKSVQDILPVSIVGNFELYNGRILGKDILFAFIEDGNVIAPAQTKKQLNVIQRKTGMVAILVSEHLYSYNINRLVAQKVNFIVPNKQMFIPSLLLDLKSINTIGGEDKKDAITPLTQCLLLYHLEIESISGKTSYELADLLAVSYASVNRALRWLVSKDLIRLEGAKTKTIQIDFSNRELWDKALPLLVSPIEKVYYTDALLEGQMMSGVNALASYTMLNEENKQFLAMTKKDFKALNVAVDKQFGQNEIQVWKYNPRILSSKGVVDKLSLYLSLKDNEDERIQIELERLISEMPW